MNDTQHDKSFRMHSTEGLKTALTIAGSDPTGGAGIQADLKTFRAFKVYGVGVTAALTVQNTEGVFDIQEISKEFLSAQLDALLSDMLPDAVKTGMLYSEENVSAVVEMIKQYSLENIVVDPVTVSSSGKCLVKKNTLDALKKELFPLAKVVTPNIKEASLLTGLDIQDEDDMKKAAVKLKELGPDTVIITGGHIAGRASDIILADKEFLTLEGETLEGEYHGTGCVFSSAVAASLALGYDVKEASVKAKEFVWKAMKSAITTGKGMKILNI